MTDEPTPYQRGWQLLRERKYSQALEQFLLHAKTYLRGREQPECDRYIRPPKDVHSVEGWNRYWGYRLSQGEPWELSFIYFEIAPLLVPVMRQKQLSTVLCVGNGISQEPRALAHAGFHVTALDLSPVATAYAESFAFTAEHLKRFFAHPQDVSSPGGTVSYETGSLLDAAVCPGPYDVIIVRRTLQLFPDSERVLALQALMKRQSQQGILVCHDHNAGPAAQNLLRAHGFHLSHGTETEYLWYDPDGTGFLSPPPGKRAAWSILSSG